MEEAISQLISNSRLVQNSIKILYIREQDKKESVTLILYLTHPRVQELGQTTGCMS